MRKTSSRKKVAMMLVPAATAGGFIGLTAQAAHAESGSQSVTYTDRDNDTVNCTITYNLIYGGDGPNTLTGATVASGDSECVNSSAGVYATYKQNSDGVQVTNEAFGLGGAAGAVWANVMNAHISNVHTIQFANCDANQSVCAYSFNLSHGK